MMPAECVIARSSPAGRERRRERIPEDMIHHRRKNVEGSPLAPGRRSLKALIFPALALVLASGVSSCSGKDARVQAGSQQMVTVGVTKAVKKSLSRRITLSSELVPFQEIDVYAKESGFVRKLNVDYGTRVKQGQVLATLEIPELEAQLDEDRANVKSASNQVIRAQHELARYQAQYKVLHLEFERLHSVSESQPGIVAQQEVDDAQGKDLAAASQVDAGHAALEAAESQLVAVKAKLAHDQTLFDYTRITAPFNGVVTERFANLGTLVQAGTNSSTQAMPLVRLSQDEMFRLVIPVPESYVRYIHVGDHVDVRVPSLNRTFPGTVARFSVDVRHDTRTMHTEVDVPNSDRVLIPGLYAEADVALEQRDNVLSVPLQAINHEAGKTTVYVVTPDGEIQDRQVELGLKTESYTEVLSGLRENEQVVLSDRSGLKPGQKVNPQTVQVMQYHETSEE